MKANENADIAPTLRSETHGHPPVVASPSTVFCIQGNVVDRSDSAGANGCGYRENVCYTLDTVDRHAVAYSFTQNQREEVRILGDCAGALPASGGTHRQTYVVDARGNGSGAVVPTITGDHESRITDYTAICVEDAPKTLKIRCGCAGGGKGALIQEDKSATLGCSNDQTVFVPQAYGIGNGQTNQSFDEEKAGALNCMHDQQAVIQAFSKWVVRRLTPLECERLQGFPDNWTDIGEWVDTKGKKHKNSSDAARYKAIGNSIAIPPWRWVLERLSEYCGDDCTMVSLFDGIGGFPYIWEGLHGAGSCVWASEIEEFPMAVTKKHFPDE